MMLGLRSGSGGAGWAALMREPSRRGRAEAAEHAEGRGRAEEGELQDAKEARPEGKERDDELGHVAEAHVEDRGDDVGRPAGALLREEVEALGERAERGEGEGEGEAFAPAKPVARDREGNEEKDRGTQFAAEEYRAEGVHDVPRGRGWRSGGRRLSRWRLLPARREQPFSLLSRKRDDVAQ